MKVDAYTFVYLTGTFRSKYEAKSEADTYPDVSKTDYSGAEVICGGENVLRGKGINREVEKDRKLKLPAKEANMR